MTEGRQDTWTVYVCDGCGQNVAAVHRHPRTDVRQHIIARGEICGVVNPTEVVPASTLQEVERERDRAVAAIQADHRHKASIGGSPCVCEWCRALSNPKEEQ